MGRRRLPIRLMVALHLFKHMDGLSDEAEAGSTTVFCASRSASGSPLPGLEVTGWAAARRRACCFNALDAEDLLAKRCAVPGHRCAPPP